MRTTIYDNGMFRVTASEHNCHVDFSESFGKSNIVEFDAEKKRVLKQDRDRYERQGFLSAYLKNEEDRAIRRADEYKWYYTSTQAEIDEKQIEAMKQLKEKHKKI